MINPDTECCPSFETEKWDNKTFQWNEKRFVKESLPTFFHLPFPPMIGKKITKMDRLITASDGHITEKQDVLILFRDPSTFKSEIYFAVNKDVKNANNVSLSGTFATRVFDGPYNSIPVHIKTMEKQLSEQNKKATDFYVHYAYCPKCARKYGHNYMILFAKL